MDKVNRLCHEGVECSRLRDLALGVIINESTEFESNPSPINFRMLHTKILNTCKVVEKRQRSVVIVEGCTVQIAESLHYSDPHWTPKPDSKGGRTLIDMSNGPKGRILNTQDVKEKKGFSKN